MEPQIIFNAVIAIGCVFVGAMLKSIYDAIKELRQSDGDIHDRINEVPNVYVRRDDFMLFTKDIKDSLSRIEDKMYKHMANGNGGGQ